MFFPQIVESIKPEQLKKARDQRKKADFPVCSDESKMKEYVVSLHPKAPFDQVDIPTGQKSVSFRKFWMHPENSVVGTKEKKQTIMVWLFSEEQVEWIKKRALEYHKAGTVCGEWIIISPKDEYNPMKPTDEFFQLQKQETSALKPETKKASDEIIKEQVKRAEAEKEKKK